LVFNCSDESKEEVDGLKWCRKGKDEHLKIG
jgi:hypothetical protein